MFDGLKNENKEHKINMQQRDVYQLGLLLLRAAIGDLDILGLSENDF